MNHTSRLAFYYYKLIHELWKRNVIICLDKGSNLAPIQRYFVSPLPISCSDSSTFE